MDKTLPEKIYLRKGDSLSLNHGNKNPVTIHVMEDNPNILGQLRVKTEVYSSAPMFLLTEPIEVYFVSRYELATMSPEALAQLREECQREIKEREDL